jgi:hypothetical protein
MRRIRRDVAVLLKLIWDSRTGVFRKTLTCGDDNLQSGDRAERRQSSLDAAWQAVRRHTDGIRSTNTLATDGELVTKS